MEGRIRNRKDADDEDVDAKSNGGKSLYPNPHPEKESATNMMVRTAAAVPAPHETLSNKNPFPRGELA